VAWTNPHAPARLRWFASTKWLPISPIACVWRAHRRHAERFASRPMVPCGFHRAESRAPHSERAGGRRGVDQEGTGLCFVMTKSPWPSLSSDELVACGRRARAAGPPPAPSAPGPLWWRAEFAKHVLDAAEPVVIGPDGADQALCCCPIRASCSALSPVR